MASTLISPVVDYYNDEEELDSVDDDDDRSFRGRDSEEDTEDASETDLAKHDEDDYVEIKEQMYQDKLASLKRQLQQLQEGTLQEYQKRMKKLDQQYKERLRNADLFLQLESEQVERNYIKEKKAAVKEFDDKKVELKENLIAELEEKKKMIENEKLTMELTGDSMEVKPIMTRKLRRRPNDPVPIPDKRRKPAPAQLNYLLTEEQIMEDLRTLNKLKSPKRAVSPSTPEHVPSAPLESPVPALRGPHRGGETLLRQEMVSQEPGHLLGVQGQHEDQLRHQLGGNQRDLGEEDERQHEDEDLPRTAAERNIRHPATVGVLKLRPPSSSKCSIICLPFPAGCTPKLNDLFHVDLQSLQ
ncbi:Sin3 histone deacetylase corepressor complex component SDS3 [Oryzias melastigma]|uniref:Sin3 histone deacetylase corepressor complex component SDS3 n=1 Tax=Oryzias melastigma TaxID=30732 RepID=A0A834BVF2_ORYME|nr:Sin3 histone deacetylase corepressor complex component SDS3 [Oryzias melastigma]